MKIDVKKVSKLSNLTLTESEEKEFDAQLNNIVSYIEKLNSLDTSTINPTYQVTGLSNAVREDEQSATSLEQKDALSGTEKVHNGLFVVEKLVETNE